MASQLIALRGLAARAAASGGVRPRRPLSTAALPLAHTDRDALAVSGILKAAKYGGRHRVSMIPGSGVGPEMMDLVRTVLSVAGCPVDFEEVRMQADGATQEDMRRAVLSVRRNGVALKGNLESFEGISSKNLELRTTLGLFAYVQRCKSIPGVETRHRDVDILVVRQNTEGEYSQLEHFNVPGVVESMKIITEAKSRQIAEFAFQTAVKTERTKVTAVHKANIMKLSDGLFLDVCRQVAKAYPQIQFNDMIVDNCCMQLVSRPQQFDVMLLPNLYGNIVGNIAAGLVGGAGLATGMNVGQRYAIFECGTRGSGAAMRGRNVANPSAVLLTAADMLEYLGEVPDARRLRLAVLAALQAGVRTPDLGGSAATTEVVAAVVDWLVANPVGAAPAGLQ